MGSRRTLVVLFAILLGAIAFQFLPSAPAEPDEPFTPYAGRVVDDEPPVTEWSPAEAVRDPFVPLVLPEPPIAADPDGDDLGEGEDLP